MIALLRAFAWLRWRSAMNYARAHRRDTLGKWQRRLGPLVTILWLLAMSPLALALTFGASALGWAMAAETAAENLGPLILRGAFFMILAAIFLLPLSFGGKQALPAVSRLLLLPIGRRQLHGVRWLSGLFDPVLMAALLPVLFLPLGLWLGGRPGVALVAWGTGLVLLLWLAALSSWVMSFAELMLSNRRQRDTLALVFLVIVLGGSLASVAIQPDETWAAFAEVVYLISLPGELFVRTLMATMDGRVAAAAGNFAALVATGIGVFLLAERAHGRLLWAATATSAAAGDGQWHGRIRLPGSPVVSEVATAQLRRLLRTVTGKLALGQGVVGVGLVLLTTSQLPAIMKFFMSPSWMMLTSALVLTGLTQIQVQFNQFAIDRAGSTLQRLLPLDTADLLRGKARAFGALAMGSMSLAILVAMFFGGSLANALSEMASALLCQLSSHWALTPMGAVVSALLPKSADLGRTFQKNQPHALAVLSAMVLLFFTLGIPLFLVSLGRLFGGPLLPVLVLLPWAAATWTFCHWSMRPVAEWVDQRSEAILLASQDR